MILKFPDRRSRKRKRKQARLKSIRLFSFLPLALAATLISVSMPKDTWRWRGSAPSSDEAVYFSKCHSGGGTNCVVDGDTFYKTGTKIRIADIDSPETHDARCDDEQQRGDLATDRLQELLNAGPVTLEATEGRDTDKYGRQLRTVYRDGVSIGSILVDEGLARPYGNGRQSWC